MSRCAEDSSFNPLIQNALIDRVRDRWQTASHVAVLTGAGISTDSGIPTFRGSDGLWKQYRAEDLATPEAFKRDPQLVWEWYDMRRAVIATKIPNPAHEALAVMEQRVPSLTVMTQNVDGLHQKAGVRNLIELHGNIWKVRCTACARIAENRDVPLRFPPLCVLCGKLLRPHIVWFGESLDPEVLNQCARALHQCHLLFVIGTSGVVQPAASFAHVAKAAGAYTIEINPDPTPLSEEMDLCLRGRAKEIVPLLL